MIDSDKQKIVPFSFWNKKKDKVGNGTVLVFSFENLFLDQYSLLIEAISDLDHNIINLS